MFENLTEEQKQEIQKAQEKEKQNREALDELIAVGTLPQLKVMKRRQRRELDASGLNISKIKRSEERSFVEIRDGMFDWILDNVYAGHNFDELDNNVCNSFALLTFQISYEDKLATKNS